MAVLREAWRKPPTNGQRWVAAHPIMYVGFVVGIVVAIGIATTVTAGLDGVIGALIVGMAVIAALAAWFGVGMLRVRIRQYDSRSAGSE